MRKNVFHVKNIDGRVLVMGEELVNKMKDFSEQARQNNFNHFYIEGIKYSIIQLIQHCTDGDINKPLGSPEFTKVKELFDRVFNEVYQMNSDDFPKFSKEHTLDILYEIRYFIDNKNDIS